MKPLLPLVAALAVPACSFPCDRSEKFTGPVQIVSGTGQLEIRCASTKQTRVYPLAREWVLGSLYDVENEKKSIQVRLDFQGDKTPGELMFEFDRTLEDGSYPVSLQTQTPVKTSLLWSRSLEGVFSFTRTRDTPFVEVSDPEPGTYTSRVDTTFAIKGQMDASNTFGFTCPEPLEYALETTSLHLEKATTVGLCDGGDVLEGLSNIRVGH